MLLLAGVVGRGLMLLIRTDLNKSIQILACADDINLIARTKRDLISASTALEEASGKIGL